MFSMPGWCVVVVVDVRICREFCARCVFYVVDLYGVWCGVRFLFFAFVRCLVKVCLYFVYLSRVWCGVRFQFLYLSGAWCEVLFYYV